MQLARLNRFRDLAIGARASYVDETAVPNPRGTSWLEDKSELTELSQSNLQALRRPYGSGNVDVTPDNHTRWYLGIQRIYRNAVVSHIRNVLRREYPQDWESVLQKPFAKEWPTIVADADLARQIGIISSTIRDEADFLGVNHFYNLFNVHFDLLFPTQRDSTPEARKQEKAAVLVWAKEIKTVRDPESHPPGDDMDLLDVVRQLDNARRICSKFDSAAAGQLVALVRNLYSGRPSNFGRGEVQTSFRQPIQVTQDSHLQADALLLGPVQSLGLEARVEQAQRLASDALADAARLYAEIAETLRGRFPGYADRFERLGAVALRGCFQSIGVCPKLFG